jgi:hypothetical protein
MQKKNLVIVPFGQSSIESPWIFDDSDRSFDVALLYYHKTITNPKLKADSGSFTLYHLCNFKWIMAHDFFQQNPDYLNRYNYFFFPDDDIEIDKNSIHVLFDLMARYTLQMTQPVLLPGSFKSWKILMKKRWSGIRYLSTVELMCPALSKDAVKELIPTFNLNKSGWGIDILWGEIIRKKFGLKSIGVFDSIGVTHTKPVGRGELYEKLGKSAFEERDEIFNTYSITKRKIYAVSIPENNWINRIKSYFFMKKFMAKLNQKKYE